MSRRAVVLARMLSGIVLLAVPGALVPSAAPDSAGAPAGWLDKVQQDLRSREYEVTWQAEPVLSDVPASWQAPNRAQGLTSYFAPEGIRVVPRMEKHPSWVWSLSLAGYGRGTTLWPVGEARQSVAGNRIDYRRGSIDEWYVNEERGLKQGFILHEPPEEAAASIGVAAVTGRVAPPEGRQGQETASLIHLDLDLGGDLLPVVAADGQAIDLVSP